MFLKIRTIIKNITGSGGKGGHPIRLPLRTGRGSGLPGPGSKLMIQGHLETVAFFTARKGHGKTAVRVIAQLVERGEIRLTHQAKIAGVWVDLDRIIKDTDTGVYTDTVAGPEPKPAPAPEPAATEKTSKPEPLPEPKMSEGDTPEVGLRKIAAEQTSKPPELELEPEPKPAPEPEPAPELKPLSQDEMGAANTAQDEQVVVEAEVNVTDEGAVERVDFVTSETAAVAEEASALDVNLDDDQESSVELEEEL